jgi:hypothetical protein
MWPDINGFYAMLYGAGGIDLSALTCWQFGNATGVVFSGNPPYTATDFLGFYPKFFGPPTSVSGLTITQGSAVVSGFASITGLAVGQLVVNPNSIPKDSLILSIDSAHNAVTLTNEATNDGTILTIYEAPPMPLVVLLWYVYLAQANISSRWFVNVWPMAIAYFIAHFCTLWMRSETGPNTTPSQIVTSGLEKGMLVGKSAGDVSASVQFLEGYDEWGSLRETSYGQQLATLARSINCGPIWVR